MRSKRMTFNDLARLEAKGRIKAQDAAIPADVPFCFEMIADLPPSVNHIYQRSRNGVRKTEAAKAYQEAFGFQAKRQGWKLVEGRVKISIVQVATLADGDLDNGLKCLLDSIQGIVVRNDSAIWKITVEREERPEGVKPHLRIKVERY